MPSVVYVYLLLALRWGGIRYGCASACNVVVLALCVVVIGLCVWTRL